MDKREYFDCLSKRDFIVYVLLKDPLYSPSEVSSRLLSKIDADILYKRIKKLIPELIQKYVPLQEIKDESGKTVEILPEGFSLEITDKLIAELRERIKSEYSFEEHLHDLMNLIEVLTWSQGVDDMHLNLKKFKDDLMVRSRHYSGILGPQYQLDSLKEKYEAAKRVTIREMIMRDNSKDVEDFIDALTSYCYDLCEVEVSLALAKLYKDISESSELNDLIIHLKELHDNAEKELVSLRALPSNPDWDSEYADKNKISFYEGIKKGEIDVFTDTRLDLDRTLNKGRSK